MEIRNVIFKAKRKDWRNLTKEEWWVEGYYVYCRKRHYILPILNKAIGFDEREDKWIEIVPDTLCQYTGLTDKNGKKIWKNDIVKNEEGDIGAVQWFEEHIAFMIWNVTKNCVCYLEENDFSKIERVGNKSDNPGLLEV